MQGYLRSNGKKGIRNTVVVAYLVECAHHVARTIVNKSNNQDIQLIGFPGCYPNNYALSMMTKLCTHPNVGGVLLVSLGCEGFNREHLSEAISQSGRPVSTLVIQNNGGTKNTIDKGVQEAAAMLEQISSCPVVDMTVDELVIGTICGGSDGTSGISANPAVGKCFDRLITQNATCIFEETGELVGCEQIMAQRAESKDLADKLVSCVIKAEKYYTKMGYGSFAPGNAEGGLTTQEEKSMGAYAKSGGSLINGIIKPGEEPHKKGLFLMDVVPDGDPKFGFPNISDNQEIIEMIASGAHITLFTTGRGSVVGSAISPVIKICANPETYKNLSDDMDINAGSIIEGQKTVEQVGDEIFDLIVRIASGEQSKSEQMGHQEFLLTYKTFDSIGPACLN
ncbi:MULTISPECIES: UxaA family hydrolase [unclassified Pseudoalteromonas]|jgi:altronate dehydratase large subunit|uniref:UxaA family hydrolase n=1 Tax=unclassified Pseudoalteromonas TaxID=194690 RepID=UPI000C49CE38|nr:MULTISPECIES: UxaA family hydrolase [unclassified Pseudoalteromonas]MBU77282.1 hydrolase [Pseudoalteromonadaceae bacterium]MCF2900027.1 UxaA family hydrolase [Pseudoalteromonas sp. OFAV1]MCO7249787.1 UxaA family hydrolase [Pseudoalteromonas sp. Ps84H-4]TMO42184.1 hydrolase [Pseudoalteromonas sp. S4389]